jgi:hypothetical protein
MKLDVYGRFQLEVQREGSKWIVYRIEPGLRIRVPELAIPAELEAADIASFLDDIYHEMAGPGQNVRVLAIESNHGRTHEPP